jgi:hypothetical protein
MKLMNLREFGNQNLLLSPPNRKGKRDSGCMSFSGSKTGQFVQDLLAENLVLLHAEFTLIA